MAINATVNGGSERPGIIPPQTIRSNFNLRADNNRQYRIQPEKRPQPANAAAKRAIAQRTMGSIDYLA